MLICRDSDFLNNVANHPDVRPFLGGQGPVDLSQGIRDGTLWAYSNLDGAFVLHEIRPGGYEIHTIFPPWAKFKETVKLCREVFEHLFLSTDCDRIFTQVPVTNKGADFLARHMGLQELMVRKGAWDNSVDVRYLDLPLDRWLPLCSTHQEQGRLFARKVGAREDDVLDRVLGGVTEMFRNGLVVKGVNTYNMWAALCVQPQMALVNEEDATIDFVGRRWGLCYEGMEVATCPSL